MTVGLIILGILLVGLIIWALSRPDDEAANTTTTTETAEQQDATVDDSESMITRITDNPASFLDQTVTVEAEVQDVLNDRVIKVSDDVAGDELTVLMSRPLTAEQAEQAEVFLKDNANVQVTGTVRQATVAEYETDYMFTVEPELEAEFESKVILVADSVIFTDQNGAQWSFSSAE